MRGRESADMSDPAASVVSITGPLVVARFPNAVMGSQAEVGAERVVGEVIRLSGDLATVQMYERTDSTDTFVTSRGCVV